ncbi:hypothetical protein [Fulvivirga sediminis]|uniref:Uncharacterized protein n=1 Tax=Fulvivirga sediminis TaxID=2803949 RepID=A0A937FD89_9BACT|nr:hypothetical protein [Fulvivirga sediminis]MBL3658408.1 hypothetical protein [Fulvivirga sediminis]
MKASLILLKLITLSGCILLAGLLSTSAQVPVTGSMTDILAQPFYRKINKVNMKMTATVAANSVALAGVEKVLAKEQLHLTTYNPMYIAEKISINKFINTDSYDLIATRYKTVKLIDDHEFMKRSKILLFMQVILAREAKNANSYLQPNNFISEGDRILLLLSSLEKVIQLSIEHEDY